MAVRIDRIGEDNINSQGKKMKIIKYNSSTDILVEFEDGVTNKTAYAEFKNGKVKHPKDIPNRLYEKNKNNFGSEMIITRYNCFRDIDVYFPEYDWTSQNRSYGEFKEKSIKCPYERTYFNVGYLGEGDYRTNGYYRDCFNTWYNMLTRCYNIENIHYRNHVYEDSYVCDEWLNYQNFAKWYYLNIYYIENEQMCLDKDILYKGNKIYSDYYCMFVPQNINKLFTKTDILRGEYPIGVYYYKNTNKFKAQCNDGKKNRINLGYHNTPEEAFQSYKEYKENLIKKIANEYEKYIPREIYKAMYEYEVEITD